MIELRHISKHFGAKTAVDDLSLTVEEGSTFVFLGTSGCGKTTTLKMINRLIEPDSGEIFFEGEDIRRQAPELLRRKMGYVLQNIGLFPHYTVRQNIAVVPQLLHWDEAKITERSEVLLEKFNLAPEQFLDKYPDELSGGQQQRVGFVRALMADPPVILMDEPLGALDPITRKQIQKEFKLLDELKGKTIVLVTHDISEAFELGDQICLMDAGKIKQIGTPLELLQHPADEFVAAFFEDNRLTYQMKTTRLSDLMETGFLTERVEDYIDSDRVVFDALSLFSNDDSGRINVYDSDSDKFFRLSKMELMEAFFKKVARNGRPD